MASQLNQLIKKGNKAAMPRKISPMLCTLRRKTFESTRYVYELKLDGYRILSYLTKKNVRLTSRSGLDYTSKYPPVAAALKKMKHSVILDGEVSVLNAEGFPDFDALQKYNGHN